MQNLTKFISIVIKKSISINIIRMHKKWKLTQKFCISLKYKGVPKTKIHKRKFFGSKKKKLEL